MLHNVVSFRKDFVPAGCQDCPAKGLTRVVADSMPEIFEDRIDVLFIGVNPGAQEAVQGIPFCGPAGQLLRRVAKRELPGRALAFTNVMLCSTGNEQAIPQAEACFKCCRENLRAVCRFFRPRIYVPCGNNAMHETGIEGSISRNQGKIFRKGGSVLIPCLHPSAILRGFASEKALAETMGAVRRALEGM